MHDLTHLRNLKKLILFLVFLFLASIIVKNVYPISTDIENMKLHVLSNNHNDHNKRFKTVCTIR